MKFTTKAAARLPRQRKQRPKTRWSYKEEKENLFTIRRSLILRINQGR